MWWFGDYNLYLGQGSELEFKALPSPTERLLGSLGLGILYAVVVLILRWLIEGEHPGPVEGASQSPTQDRKADIVD
jgi:hypothetical protein